MCDIYKDNFEEKYPLIESAIRKADFIGMELFWLIEVCCHNVYFTNFTLSIFTSSVLYY